MWIDKLWISTLDLVTLLLRYFFGAANHWRSFLKICIKPGERDQYKLKNQVSPSSFDQWPFLTLLAPIPQNGQTHSNNLSAI